MKLINDDTNSDVIIWSPKGDGFVIMNKSRLTTEVLPKVFKLTQYTSFTRRLKRWGFVTARGFSTTPSYHHPLFRRNDPTSIKKMRPLSRRHQYRRRAHEQFSQPQNPLQPNQAQLLSMYNVALNNPNLALEMAYFDRLRSMNYPSNGTSFLTVPNSMLINMAVPSSQNIMLPTQNSMPPSQSGILSSQNFIPNVNLNRMETYNNVPSVYNPFGNIRMLNQTPTFFQAASGPIYANAHGNVSSNGTGQPSTLLMNSQQGLNRNDRRSGPQNNYDAKSRHFLG